MSGPLTFDEMFPDAAPLQGFECKGDEVFRGESSEVCSECKQRETHWLSIGFGAYFCGPQCLDDCWHGYLKATSQ